MNKKINEFANLNLNAIKKKDSFKDVIIEITDKDGNVAYASNRTMAAKGLGVSKQMITNCINLPNKFKTCRGCKIRVVDRKTLAPIENT